MSTINEKIEKESAEPSLASMLLFGINLNDDCT